MREREFSWRLTDYFTLWTEQPLSSWRIFQRAAPPAHGSGGRLACLEGGILPPDVQTIEGGILPPGAGCRTSARLQSRQIFPLGATPCLYGRRNADRHGGASGLTGLAPQQKMGKIESRCLTPDQRAKEIFMPTYEYICKKCNKKFSSTMSIREHDKKKIRCPKCSSTEVAQSVQAFFATTSKKS
jgi:putative FmdB family regulatory protein